MLSSWQLYDGRHYYSYFQNRIVLVPQSGEGNGTPLQYSCLENHMDGGAWWAAVRGVTKSQTRLSDFTFTFHFHALEKEMATHSNVLAWRIPGTGEPGGLPSTGSHRVRHDWSDLAAAAAVPQSCTTLGDRMDCSPPGSSVHVILQASILEWIAMPSSRGSSWPRGGTHISCISCITDGFFTTEPLRKPIQPTVS